MSKRAFGYFFCIVIFILLVLNLVRSFSDATPVTFTGLLEYLSNAPTFEFTAFGSYRIVADWGLFNFLKDFLNLFIDAFNVSIWIGELALNLIQWLLYFLRYFLLF